MDNEVAEQHYLMDCEQLFFKHHINAVNIKLANIIEEQQLKGKFTVSQDFKWLIKVGD